MSIIDRRCPKCAGSITELVEVWMGDTMSFDVADLDNGWSHQSGCPSHVEAICGACNHQWRLRGVDSIQDLRNERVLGVGGEK